LSNINIIFPNQLFEKSLLIENLNNTYLIEEYLFFKQYKFHKQKILFHRDSMKNYNDYLIKKGLKVIYIDSQNNNSDIREFLKNTKAKQINVYNPEDNWLEKRISSVCSEKNIEIKFYENPLFINKQNELTTFFKPEKKKLFQTSFYKNQRTRLNILLDNEKNPVQNW
jgi:deoxyribodipyrimidine photolyase-related protein